MKVGIGKHNSDADINLSARGLVYALTAELVDADGNQMTNLGLVTRAYDSIVPSYPDNVTEVYVYKSGGVSGTTVATVTVTYTDATKERYVSIVKT